MFKKDLVGIICYNEGKSIGQLLSELENQLANHNFEVILFDDNSNDRSRDIAQENNIKIVINEGSKGYSNNVMSALRFFSDNFSHGSRLLILDGDMEHKAHDLPQFLRHEYSFDLVVGSRDRKNRWSEEIVGLISNFFLEIPDPFCGMRMFSIKFVKSFLDTHSLYCDGIAPIIFSKISKNNFKSNSVKISVGTRVDSSRFGTGIYANLKLIKTVCMALIYAYKK